MQGKVNVKNNLILLSELEFPKDTEIPNKTELKNKNTLFHLTSETRNFSSAAPVQRNHETKALSNNELMNFSISAVRNA